MAAKKKQDEAPVAAEDATPVSVDELPGVDLEAIVAEHVDVPAAVNDVAVIVSRYPKPGKKGTNGLALPEIHDPVIQGWINQHFPSGKVSDVLFALFRAWEAKVREA